MQPDPIEATRVYPLSADRLPGRTVKKLFSCRRLRRSSASLVVANPLVLCELWRRIGRSSDGSVAPFAAGGSTDAIARIVADGLSSQLHQPVIVGDIAGAGGMTGTNRVAKAVPNGNQFVLGNVGTHARTIALQETALRRRDRFRACGPHHRSVSGAGLAQRFPGQQSAGVRRLREGEPVEAAVSSAGVGGSNHLACVLLNSTLAST